VLDIRDYMGMLELDMASRSIEDRAALHRQVFGDQAKDFAIESEVVRLVEDTDHDGVADKSSVYADGFNSELDGIASGVLARHGQVWFTNIPSLWLLEGEAGKVKKTELLRGFGVRYNFTGHDFHGLVMGHDGKLYFSIGDRGMNVKTKEGGRVAFPDEGAVFRSNPDGTELEIVHRGLRNPQELTFDEHGNLFTGDNDSDQGDQERLVYLVEGGDSGWRVGYQHAPLGKGGPGCARACGSRASTAARPIYCRRCATSRTVRRASPITPVPASRRNTRATSSSRTSRAASRAAASRPTRSGRTARPSCRPAASSSWAACCPRT
jgi:hypothetical protein